MGHGTTSSPLLTRPAPKRCDATTKGLAGRFWLTNNTFFDNVLSALISAEASRLRHRPQSLGGYANGSAKLETL